MRMADRTAIVSMKIPSLKLMETAGLAVANETERLALRLRIRSSAPISIVCGKGNNGGDGLVAGRCLSRRGYRVQIFLMTETLSEDAAVQLKRLPKSVPVVRINSWSSWERVIAGVRAGGLIIDALFGTGLSKPIRGWVRRWIESLNATGRPVVAVDIPSGIDASTGKILGAAVRARVTVTFARPKIGHLFHPGAACTGELIVADIGIPDRAVLQSRPDTFLIDRPAAARLLPPRLNFSHKGMYGRSVIAAGSRGMIGAAVLAAESAMRIGSGLTHLCVPDSVYPIAARKLSPEAMCAPVPDRRRGSFGPESVRESSRIAARATCVLAGPGIGRHPDTGRWLMKFLRSIHPNQKLILDADALWAIARSGFDWRDPRLDVAITPHAGEMARLTGLGRSAVESDFCSVARAYSVRNRITVVLKGSRTVIASRSGRVDVNRTGNSALAKGATGDVLAGMICGLAAQGLSTFDAARLAVYLHGRCADIAVDLGRNKRTFLASDLFDYFDPAILELEQEGRDTL